MFREDLLGRLFGATAALSTVLSITQRTPQRVPGREEPLSAPAAQGYKLATDRLTDIFSLINSLFQKLSNLLSILEKKEFRVEKSSLLAFLGKEGGRSYSSSSTFLGGGN